MPPPHASRPQPVSAADVEAYPAGGDAWIVSCLDDGRVHLLDQQALGALTACSATEPLDVHARALAGAGLDAAAATAVLERLAGLGLLRGLDDLAAAWGRRPPTRRAAVAWVAMPTRDRPRTATGNLASVLEHTRGRGRAPDLLLSDDTEDPAGVDRLRRHAAALARSTGTRVHLWDRRARATFADRLAMGAGVEQDLARFALLGAPGRPTVGANRNAVLLLLAGSCVAMLDDDVAWRPARPPGAGDGVLLGPAGDARDVWFFGSRADALDAAEPADVDVLAAHEDWLGRDPGPPLAEVAAHDLLRSESPAALRRMTAGPGRVAVTSTGTVGDCGWDNPFYYLFLGEEATRRLLAGGDAYRDAHGRDLAQAAPRTTLAGAGTSLMAGSMALHAEELLPPFPPTGRAEDAAFGTLLDRCFPRAWAAHLPVLLPHDPPGTRSWGDGPMISAGSGSWLAAVLGGVEAGRSPDPRRRLATAGRGLRDLAAAGDRAFAEEVRHQARASLSALVGTLEDRARRLLPDAPEAYVRDVERFVEAARRAAVTGDATSGTGPAELRAAVDRFGRLLEAWPALWDTAAELRARGATDDLLAAVGTRAAP